MSTDPDARLREHLENCKIPLSRDDWAGFFKGLDAQNQTYRNLYDDWIKPRRAQISKTTLDDGRVKDSFILALHQIRSLRSMVGYLELRLKEECEAGGNAGLNKKVNEWWPQHQKQEAKKKRDLKPAAPGVTKNWLEPMAIFNDGEPCGYVQATGQTRKVIGDFIRSIKAKPTSKLVKKERGKPKDLYGFKTNCRVLDQWLTGWCDQEPEKKYAVVLREALILAAAVADSKIPVKEKRLARVRSILKTNVKHAAKQIDADSDFNFLCCRAACISEIKSLNESLPKPRDERPFKLRFSDYVIKVLAGEPAEYPLP